MASGILFLSGTAAYGQAQSKVCFKSLSDYSIPTGANPSSISTGDLNGDGKQDIAVANAGDGTVQVLFGTAGRRFVKGPAIDAGDLPLVVLTTDVDGDDDLDLAVLRSTAISIELNDGNGEFDNSQIFSVADAIRMATGDFTNDGKMDLLSSGAEGLYLHVSNGDGTFTSPQTIDAGATNSLKVVDFNNDDKMDIVYSIGTVVKMLSGNGDGTFTLKDSATHPDVVLDFGCGDVNDDGQMDVLTVADNNTTWLLTGDGTGNFDDPLAFSLAITDDPVITDVDGDGENDIVVGRSGGASVRIYYGLGGGTYDDAGTFLAMADQVIVDDMDGDGKNDLVTVSPSDEIGGVTVSFAQGSTFDTIKFLEAPVAAEDSFTDDLNGDGKPDIVISERASRFFVYLNSAAGYGAAVPYEPDPAATIIGLEKGKFNADLHTDLVVTLTTGKISVWINDGNGGFTERGQYNSGAMGGDITANDFNGDDNLDLAVTLYSDNMVSILAGDGTGAFGTPDLLSAGNAPTSIASGFIDNDDDIDLMVGNEGNDKVSMLLGNDNGTFTGPLDIIAGSDIDNHITLQDLNNDGLPELIALGFHQNASGDKGYVAIRRNLGNGFGARIQYQCAGGRKGIGFGDFNGDGRMDVAVAGLESCAMEVFTGNGDATLNSPDTFAAGKGLIAATADTNGDGATDIIAVSQSDGALLILENTTARAVAAGPTTFCTGSVTLNANDNATFYEWSGGPDPSSNSSIVASVRGIYTVTTSNYSGRCSTSSSVSVNGPPATPEVDAHNPTCNDLSASISVTPQDDADSYSFDNAQTFQASNTMQNVAEGTYQVVIRSVNGCLSEPAEVSITAAPPIPAAAQASITDPTCEIPTGSIEVNVIDPTYTYSFDEGNTYISDHIMSGLPPGLYFVIVKDQQGCKSPVAEFTVNNGPSIPQSLSVATTDPTCTEPTGSISVIIQSETDTYSFDNGQTFQASNTKIGLQPDVYQVVVKNEEGCNSEPTETIIYPRPLVPTIPVAQVIQPGCSEATGSIAIVMQSEFEEYSFDNGATFQPNKQLSVAAPGTYSIFIKSVDDCLSPPGNAIVKSPPATPPKPEVSATTQSNGDVVLHTTSTAAEYYWFREGSPVPGSGSSYIATQSGNYAVLVISADGCSSKPSDAVSVVVVGDIYDGVSTGFGVYPNPATTMLYYDAETPGVNARLFAASGAEIRVNTIRSGTQLVLDVSQLSPGLYLLRVEESGVAKTIRWVKR
jgi:hypothetical protein